ncbi:MAG: hypothetical protein ACI9AR_000527, partial [Flavobacteriaceae bacterium]
NKNNTKRCCFYYCGIIFSMKDFYSVYLCVSKAPLPLSFAVHGFFVIEKNNAQERYEVLSGCDGNCDYSIKGYVHRNKIPDFDGLPIIYLNKNINIGTWKSRIISKISGQKDSLAHEMYDYIKNNSDKYTHSEIYNLFFSNSNSYIKWILDAFPEWKVSLPWNAFGKKIKNRLSRNIY